ncbi:hypothetical protein IEQ34_021986 [Dendrobium chrysotoxum]|uniref:Uncharacterized protein n=1 Tax=Dendrobium chrysotoxum TaxID=161865 RepID=A0AAV7FVV4_DENCH|nr:hypothetical protein IEQ34_021986 [Dendrobium chrysotoxum]
MFQFLKSRSSIGGENDGEHRERVGGSRRQGSIFWLLGKLREVEEPAPEKMRRSTSVAEKKISGLGIGWNWHFLNPNFTFLNQELEKVFGTASF